MINTIDTSTKNHPPGVKKLAENYETNVKKHTFCYIYRNIDSPINLLYEENRLGGLCRPKRPKLQPWLHDTYELQIR